MRKTTNKQNNATMNIIFVNTLNYNYLQQGHKEGRQRYVQKGTESGKTYSYGGIILDTGEITLEMLPRLRNY